MNCPDCGGAMWDNRESKKNPKSPDFKCKNKDGCGKGVWEKKGDAAPANRSSNGNGHAPITATRPLGPLYNECMVFAKAACAHHFGDHATPDVVVAATATLFIQATKGDAPIRAPKPAPAPPPPPPPPPAPASSDRYYEDDPLPF
jgi:hypothetical protein